MTSKNSEISRLPLPVQILAVIGYTGFAIPVSIIAIGEFGVLGLALAAFLGWQWTRVLAIGPYDGLASTMQRLKPRIGDADADASRNTGFDAYRAALMQRLEDEQRTFDGFVERLRDARDRTEFDAFMDEREARNRSETGHPA